MKKILAVTGIRSEYDILYPVLKRLKENGNFDVKVIAVGAHLSDWHGNTVKRIEQDEFQIAEKIDYLLMTNRKTQRSKGVGLLIAGLTQTVERENPDFLIFVGDREESIATCIVGNYMNVLTIHIGGGDPVFGNADDPIRFACSKLAHIHITSASEYSNNLLKLGEENFRILQAGNPVYENIANEPKIDLNKISNYLDIDVEKNNYIVMLKHPLSSEVENTYEQMKISIEAVKEFAKKNKMKVVGIYPNTDPGSYDILKAIEESQDENIKFYKTLPRDIFINLMRNAKCIVGNSSMGILEAPFYKLPAVNIGNRQKGRLNAGNVEFVGYKKQEIIKAIEKACFDENYINHIKNLKNPFGDETASIKISEFLNNIDLNDRKWYVKQKLC